MLSIGFTPREIVHRLALERDVDPVRARLVVDVAEVQNNLLAPLVGRHDLISLYIGIPFCPSRCTYCSFPSHSLTQYRRAAREEYCRGLEQELWSVGQDLEQLGLKVCTCYIGGGTPTTLTAGQLERLLAAVHRLPLWEGKLELTIEAGRPDTIDRENLAVMPKNTRLSINPQSMHDHTLAIIGRSHTVEQIREKVFLAREMGFANINMDLIVGLPGENAASVEQSIEAVLSLAPESVTIHMFAPKRASRFGEGERWAEMPEGEALVASDTASTMLAQAGFRPYYLYRQRGILAGLENVGWAKPGKECLYNMLIIGERQSIIGVGAGASSMFPRPTGPWQRHAHPKDAKVYLDRLHKSVENRRELLREWRNSQ